MIPNAPIETSTLDHDAEPEDWLEEPEEELPRRPRRKLLAPIPLTLLTVLLIACAFFAGVQIEKEHTSSSTTGFPAGLAALRGRTGTSSSNTTGSSGTSSVGAGGFPGAGGSGFPGAGSLSGGDITTGEVTFANGHTLYVTSSEGNTVKVSAPDGTTVTKTVSTSVDGIHPGDTVVIRGSQSKSGGISASSITISSSSGSSGTGSSSTSASSANQELFGAG